tara:strand:- start:274 stop:1035 length:762 start_codon:yes stop_codon:yes gene_type:complete
LDNSILIQARLSSSRLPGKILFKLGNTKYSALSLICERLRSIQDEFDIAFITSVKECDNAISFAANSEKFKCYRGSHKDVLKRYFDCATFLKSKTIIRLTSDCPFIDPNEIKRVLKIHQDNQNDYTTNTFEGSTIVDGFDVEVFSFEALKRAFNEAVLPSHREHVTFYFKKENNFKIQYVDPELNFPYTRLTLDTPEDFEAISKLIETIDGIEKLSMIKIIELFYKFNLNMINSSIKKNHGWINSLNEDKKYE